MYVGIYVLVTVLRIQTNLNEIVQWQCVRAYVCVFECSKWNSSYRRESARVREMCACPSPNLTTISPNQMLMPCDEWSNAAQFPPHFNLIYTVLQHSLCHLFIWKLKFMKKVQESSTNKANECCLIALSIASSSSSSMPFCTSFFVQIFEITMQKRFLSSCTDIATWL